MILQTGPLTAAKDFDRPDVECAQFYEGGVDTTPTRESVMAIDFGRLLRYSVCVVDLLVPLCCRNLHIDLVFLVLMEHGL